MNLSNKQVKEVLLYYNLGSFKSKKLIYNAWNTSYKIITTKGSFLLKVLNFNNAKKFKHEIEVNKKLKNRIPCVFPLRTKKDQDYIIYNKKITLILPFIDGKPVYRGETLSISNLKKLGRYFAIIHKTRNIHGISKFDFYQKIFSLFKKSPNSVESKIANATFSVLKKNHFTPSEYPNGLVHGDFHTENLLMSKNKIIAIIDFEEAHVGSFIEDIALGIIDTCWMGSSLSNYRINNFIEGYESIRKLTQKEKEHLLDAGLFGGLIIFYFCVLKNGFNNKKNFEHYTVKHFLRLLKR